MSSQEEEIIQHLRSIYVGSLFHWMPMVPYASEWCRVVDLQWNGKELLVKTEKIIGRGITLVPTNDFSWNELGHFVESSNWCDDPERLRDDL